MQRPSHCEGTGTGNRSLEDMADVAINGVVNIRAKGGPEEPRLLTSAASMFDGIGSEQLYPLIATPYDFAARHRVQERRRAQWNPRCTRAEPRAVRTMIVPPHTNAYIPSDVLSAHHK